MNLLIRMIESPKEMTRLDEIQRRVWGGDVVPAHIFIAAVRNGGLLLGAFDGSEMIGFVFGFPSVSSDGLLSHLSHTMGILPEYQGKGVGFALKQAQWQEIRRRGINLITWTYDPLLSINANLNISYLGGICRTYIREYYGEMQDVLNAGLPSDRFHLELWVDTPRVVARMEKRPRERLSLETLFSAGAQILNPVKFDPKGNPVPPEKTWVAGEVFAGLEGFKPDAVEPSVQYLLEIPSNFQALRSFDPDLARRWRFHTHVLFEDLFARGYVVDDFLFTRVQDTPRSFYILSRG